MKSRGTLRSSAAARGWRVALVIAGLAGSGSAQVWEPGNRRIDDPEGPQVQARWGSFVAVGDFEGDGYADLAVGAFHRDQISLEDSGEVSVWSGGPGGLATARDFWLLGGAADRQCGYALATGDFDGDGDDELVVSCPGDSSHGVDHGGEVRVFDKVGTSWGLDSIWHQGGPIPVANEPFDQFGQSLAVGDFDFDGFDDLVIGVPRENIDPPLPTALDGGAVAVVYGSPSGLATSGVQFFHEALAALGGAQANARFGFSLATGQFNRDLYEDLVVGIPFRDAAGAADAGQVVVLFGGADGLSTAGVQRLDDADFGGLVEAGDQFGFALAAGQFRSTGACPVLECYDELALGIPGEPVGGAAAAGGLLEVRGSVDGLDPGTAIFWTQDSLTGMSDPEAGDRLGAVLVAGELDRREGEDLLIGVPEEDWVSNSDQGMVHLAFGGPQGLVLSYPGQSRLQDGLASGPGDAGDRFGQALGVGDFDGDGHGDVALGVPGRAVGPEDFAGTVQLMRGALFADGFQSGSTNGWSSSTP